MPKALIVSRYFPPLSSAGGSIRLIKFIKYLSAMGWKFIVLTQDIHHTVVPEQALSAFLLDELPQDTLILRVPAPFSDYRTKNTGVAGIFRTIIGDSSLVWGIKVIWKGLLFLRKTEFHLVFSVTPPFTNAFAAMLISWLGHKPHILDLKDDWVGSPTFLQKGFFRQEIEKLLESLIVRNASAVTTVTPPSYDLYNERYAYLGQSKKFHFIPNGCDLDEYHLLEYRQRDITSDRFLILSAAWGFRKDYRDISPFLWALDEFFKRHIDAKDSVDVVLLGDSLSEEYRQLLVELSLDRVIRVEGAVGRNELIEWLWKADLFLLIQPVNNATAISGTLYEYWATGKAPILLISEDGASSALVEDNQIGRHFLFDQVRQIAEYIEKIFEAYQSRQPVWIERECVQNFDRKMLSKRMDDIWRSIVAEK